MQENIEKSEMKLEDLSKDQLIDLIKKQDRSILIAGDKIKAARIQLLDIDSMIKYQGIIGKDSLAYNDFYKRVFNYFPELKDQMQGFEQ